MRNATFALSAGRSSTAKPESARAAAITRAAAADGPTTATWTTSAGRFRKAMPNPMARMMGKANVQNTASGSRRYSLKRTLDSWTNDGEMPIDRRCGVSRSLIAQLSPGEVDEHVLERCRVRAQFRQLKIVLCQLGQEGRNAAMQLDGAKLPCVTVVRGAGTPNASH